MHVCCLHVYGKLSHNLNCYMVRSQHVYCKLFQSAKILPIWTVGYTGGLQLLTNHVFLNVISKHNFHNNIQNCFSCSWMWFSKPVTMSTNNERLYTAPRAKCLTRTVPTAIYNRLKNNICCVIIYESCINMVCRETCVKIYNPLTFNYKHYNQLHYYTCFLSHREELFRLQEIKSFSQGPFQL